MGKRDLWVGSPLSWLESGWVSECCRLPLTASPSCLPRTVGTNLHTLLPSLRWSVCKSPGLPLPLDCHSQKALYRPFLGSLFIPPLQLRALCSLVSHQPNFLYLHLFLGCSLHFVALKLGFSLRILPPPQVSLTPLEPLGLEVAPWFSLILANHSHSFSIPSSPAFNLMSPENVICYSSLLQESVGPQLTVLVFNTVPVTVLGNINIHREDPSRATQFCDFLSNDLKPLHTSDTHSYGFTLDLVITINCNPPDAISKHPTLCSPPPTAPPPPVQTSPTWNSRPMDPTANQTLPLGCLTGSSHRTYPKLSSWFPHPPLKPAPPEFWPSRVWLRPKLESSSTILFILTYIQSVGKHYWFYFQDLSKL